LTNQQD
jgi:hypothetical protein